MIDRSLCLALALAATMTAAPGLAAHGGKIVHVQKDDSPIAGMVIVPPGATTYYVSGMIPSVVNPNAPKGSVESYGDTKTQTESALGKIKDALAEQHLGFGDVVAMHVYLAGDPSKDGKMDFAGMMEAYKEFFGTPEQPNKPARSTVQVAALVAPGALIEIEVIAAKAP
jgi:enamine deaminase RidA (YjgF/YER057c/UK114 family)